MAQSDAGAGDAGRAMDALRRIVRALRISSRAVERDVGVSGAQLFVLRQLSAAPGLSLNDLVARTLTHQSTVSEVVSRLVERGLVSRRAAADDARRAELQLTAKGRALLRGAPEAVQEDLVTGFGRLPSAQRRALADALGAWIEASGLADVEPTMFFEVSRSAGARRATSGARRNSAARADGDGTRPGKVAARTATTTKKRSAARGNRRVRD